MFVAYWFNCCFSFLSSLANCNFNVSLSSKVILCDSKVSQGGGGGGQRNLFPCLAIRWQYLSALSIVEGFYNHNTSPWRGWLFSWFSVSVLEESWCWESSTFEFQVSEADVSDLQFVQSGYILKCILSHDITLVSTAVLYTTTFLWYTIALCIPYLLCTFVFTFVPSVSLIKIK